MRPPFSLSHKNRLLTSEWQRRQAIAFTLVCWFALGIGVLWIIQQVIGPIALFILAALLAAALRPCVKYIQRVFPRLLAITFVYVILIVISFIILYFIAVTFINDIQRLVRQLQLFFENRQQRPEQGILGNVKFSVEQWKIAGQELIAPLQNGGLQLRRLLGGLTSLGTGMLVIITLSVYFLLDGERICSWLYTKTPRSQRERIHFFLTTLIQTMSGMLRGQLLLALLVSFLMGIVIWLLGVPFGTFLAVVALFLQFLPVIGSMIIVLLGGLLALPMGWVTTAWAMLCIALILFGKQILLVVLPARLFGRAVGLHPIVALLALLIGGALFGFWGALFSLPIAAFIQNLLISTWITWQARHPEEFTETGEESHTVQR